MASPFNLEDSFARAARRLGDAPARPDRARRSDRGRSRLGAGVLSCVAEALSGQERPRTKELLARIERCCRERGLDPPSRATVYKLMALVPCPVLRTADLPPSVVSALYNLGPQGEVPAHQVAFYCFNYGDLAAMSFAAGLPWLALYQALRLPGYRQKSRGLLEAAACVRGI